MSTSYYTYVGPYICVKRVKVKGTESIRSCSKPTCYTYSTKVWDSGTKFCVKCGSEIALRNIDVDEDKFDFYELLADYEDNLASLHDGGVDKEDHILIPNQRGPREFDFGRDDWVQLDLPATARDEELAWMLDKYKEEIAIIKEKMGEDVQICWGVVSHAS